MLRAVESVRCRTTLGSWLARTPPLVLWGFQERPRALATATARLGRLPEAPAGLLRPGIVSGRSVGGRRHPESVPRTMPAACRLCGGRTGIRSRTGGTAAWTCARCGWRLGDAPDADLPRPVVAVVYYLRFDRRVKIGTSERPRQRISAIRHDELLAFEFGGRELEQQRHREFAELREGGEWFTLDGAVAAHVAALRAAASDPWAAYDRRLADAYRAQSS